MLLKLLAIIPLAALVIYLLTISLLIASIAGGLLFVGLLIWFAH